MAYFVFVAISASQPLYRGGAVVSDLDSPFALRQGFLIGELSMSLFFSCLCAFLPANLSIFLPANLSIGRPSSFVR